mgnify:FL=1
MKRQQEERKEERVKGKEKKWGKMRQNIAEGKRERIGKEQKCLVSD